VFLGDCQPFGSVHHPCHPFPRDTAPRHSAYRDDAWGPVVHLASWFGLHLSGLAVLCRLAVMVGARHLPCLCRSGVSLGLTGLERGSGAAAAGPRRDRFNVSCHREVNMRPMQRTTAMALALMVLGMPAWADMEAAKKFLDSEISDLSSLSREDQEKEMQWFIDAAKPLAGMEIKVVSETIATHEYEAKVLAPAFTAITGIKVTHDLIGEGDVVEKLQTQMQTGENIYDAYVNDSDLIGTHWRYQQA